MLNSPNYQHFLWAPFEKSNPTTGRANTVDGVAKGVREIGRGGGELELLEGGVGGMAAGGVV